MSGLIDSWEVVEKFEKRMAEYCGAPYAVAVDTCTSALFLCLKLIEPTRVEIPARTYLGVATSIIHSGASLILEDIPWTGYYQLGIRGGVSDGMILLDSACDLRKGMYVEKSLMCLSFQYRKHLKIGRGGMILCPSESVAWWLRKARFCGRDEHNKEPQFVGWHCYMEPERASRGLVLMDSLLDYNLPLRFDYPDLRTYRCLLEDSR